MPPSAYWSACFSSDAHWAESDVTSPLAEYFRQRGVPLQEFGGEAAVPLHFVGRVDEHLATRRNCGLFDFSFMACIEIAGPDSLPLVHRVQTRSLSRLVPGRLAYTLLLRPDGMVHNDATVWCLDAQRYWLFTGRRDDVEHVRACSSGCEVLISDRSREHAVLAVQGPRSWTVINRCVSGLPPAVGYYTFCDARFEDTVCRVARVGYSGETGYELVVGIRAGLRLWQALVAAGRDCGMSECGFESADSLRIEAGHILFTRELAFPVGPFELGLGRLLDFDRAPALGMAPLRARRWKEPSQRLVGLIPDSADPAAVAPLLESGSRSDRPACSSAAQLTSVCMSPIFGRLLGLGFVGAEDRYPGTRVILTRGLRARVARLPFYDPARLLARR